MRKISMILLLTILILAACNSSSNQGGSELSTLNYGVTSAIEQLNPILTEEGHSELISLVFRGLMKHTEDNEVTGDIAKSFTISEDEKTYTFTLHEATWHDGQPITSEDVVYTLELIRSKDVASPYFSDFQTVSDVRVIDPLQVVIEVSEPTPTLLDKLKVGLLPKHIFEQTDLLTAKENKAPIGNGPYKLESWTTDDVLTFSAFKDFYGKKPEIEEIIVYTKLDENSKMLRLKMGELDLAQITPQQQETVSTYNGVTIKKIETADYRALQFNQKHPQLADNRVRTAINYFMDRAEMQSIVLKDTGEQAFGPLQRSFARLDQDIYSFDEIEAEQLLAEAGYEKCSEYYELNGQPLSFEVVAPITDPVRVSIATIIVEQLQQQGINASLQTKDWANIKIEEEDSFMIGWGNEGDPDTHTFRVFHSSEHASKGYNYALVDNAEIDAALVKAKSGTKEERTVAYKQFQELLAEEMAFSFLVYVDGLYAISEQLLGVSDRSLGHNGFGILWNIEEWSCDESVM